MSKAKDVTVVLTSCNRPDELAVTLSSFFKHNTYPIAKFIIIDDSGLHGCVDKCLRFIPSTVEIVIVYNENNIGQASSIDKAYSLVDTEYIFHCEDDWGFYDYGFIEKSMEILESNPRIFTVWLREYRHGRVVENGHPVLPSINDNLYRFLGVFQERTNIWCGFTFNPGLRRTADCMLLHPYSQYKDSTYCNCGGIEQALSNLYYRNGFVSAITLKDSGYVRHIGSHNSTQGKYSE